MNPLPLVTRIKTAHHLLATYSPEEYEAFSAEQRVQIHEAPEYLGVVQQWFPGGMTADA